MADTAAHNVVNGTQSVGDSTPTDAPQNTPTTNRAGGGEGDEKITETHDTIQHRATQDAKAHYVSASDVQGSAVAESIIRTGSSAVSYPPGLILMKTSP